MPCRYLYDSPLESQLTQLFDGQKRLLYTGDAVPEEVSLVKGEHTARVMLRHDNITLLEKLKNTCLVRAAWGGDTLLLEALERDWLLYIALCCAFVALDIGSMCCV